MAALPYMSVPACATAMLVCAGAMSLDLQPCGECTPGRGWAGVSDEGYTLAMWSHAATVALR